ncbi:MAG: thiamine pyrophosphate-dependent enzyme [Conexivisphaera sp.]|jgi:2-oxoglutarate ferredoxin oxidoreductase subunit beta
MGSEVNVRQATRIPLIYEGKASTFCPGCEHGLLLKLIARALVELGVADRAVMVGTVGCSSLGYVVLDTDFVQAPHGRAPAVMAGIKLVEPDSVVFAVQGDGDALSIGLQELIYAASRGTPMTVFMYNNMTFGMTGGQMAPTTIPGMRTTTTPRGRDVRSSGGPMDACRILSAVDGPAYLRRAVLAPRPIRVKGRLFYSTREALEAYRIVMNAFRAQLMGGFSFVEFLGSCNVNWRMGIDESKAFVHEVSAKYFPPALCRDLYGLEGKV